MNPKEVPSEANTQNPERFQLYSLHPESFSVEPGYNLTEEGKEDRLAEFEDDRTYYARELVESVPHNETGVATRRVHDFFNGLGLKTDPYIITDQRGVAIAKEIGKGTSLGNFEANEGELAGGHLSDLRISLINRDKLFSNAGVERVLVHELAHSTGQETGTIGPSVIDITRSGFALPTISENCGGFLEEGFAGLIEGAYADINGLVYPEEYDLGVIKLPAKYTRVDRPQGFNLPNLAAMGVELLAAQDDELYDTMLAARRDPEALHEVEAHLNRLSPGLYQELQAFPNTFDGFTEGLKKVFATFHRGENPTPILLQAPERAQTREHFMAMLSD